MTLRDFDKSSVIYYQMLLNSHHGGVRISTESHHDAQDLCTLKIIVSDDGIGMPTDVLVANFLTNSPKVTVRQIAVLAVQDSA